MRVIKLNECTLDELKELLKLKEEVIFNAEYKFDANLLVEINKQCRENIKLSLFVNNDAPIDLLKLIPNIQQLIIAPVYECELKTLEGLSDLKNLHSLQLALYVKENISFAPVMHINTLHEFDFDNKGLAHKTQYEFINLQKLLKKLSAKKIDLSLLNANDNLTDLKIFRTLLNEDLLADKFPNLKKLNLHAHSSRDKFLFIENLSELEEITINYNKHLTTFPKIKNPEKVKSICMLTCPNFTDIDSLLSFENLEELCLTSYDKPLQVAANDFIKLKQLKKLRRVYTAWGSDMPNAVEKLYNETGWINSMAVD